MSSGNITGIESDGSSTLSHLSVILKQGEVKIPIYIHIPRSNCARVARTIAMEVFGKDYSTRVNYGTGQRYPNAWDYRYAYKTKGLLNSSIRELEEDINRLQINESLSPGILFGISNPDSPYKNERDIVGRRVSYTHLAVFLGKDEADRSFFAEQLDDKIQIVSAREVSKRGHKFVETIFPTRCDSKALPFVAARSRFVTTR